MKIVDINFGGVAKKKYKLKFGVKAFTQIEELSNHSLAEMDMSKMESLFVLLTAGLRWMDNKITVDKVMTMTDEWIEKVAEEKGVNFFEAMGFVMEDISNLVSIAMGTDDEETPIEEEKAE